VCADKKPMATIASVARRSRGVRVGVRAGAALALIVLVGAVGSIVALRQHVGRQQATASMISDVRVDIAGAESVQWQSLAEGAPNFTFQDQTRTLSARLVADGALLRRGVTLDAADQRVLALIESYRASLAHEQSALAAHRLSYARQLDNTDVTPTAQLVNDALGRLGADLTARANAGQAAADRTALGIAAAVAALIALLTLLIGRTRRRAAAAARGMLRTSEQRMRSLVRNSTDVVVIVDPDSTITYVTDSVERVLGNVPASLLGRRLTERVGEDAGAQLEATLHRLAAPGHAASTAVWPIQHADGRTLAIEATGANMLLEPSVGGLVITLRDVTERRAMEEQLRHQAFHDPLTGLANRALFEDRVRHGLQRLSRVPGELSVLLIDLDDFKTVNDSLGHAAGDRLLLEVAKRMHDCLRTSDTVARLGGDEFGVLIEDPAADDGSAEELAERLLDCVGRPLEVDGHFLSVHASAGVAHRSELGTSADELMRNADIALYAAKDDGKSRVRAFEAEMLDIARLRLSLREDLKDAIERDELRVVYQPITNLHDGSVHSLEALLRWEHPQDGVISPADFIPLAEETGLIVPIGHWVLERACADLRRWHQAGHPGLQVSVNVSAVQLARAEFVDDVRDVLRASEVSAERLILELTESTLVDDRPGAPLKLAALRELGVRISVDDFGTGYSSLSYLRRLAVDSLKIDRSFIASLDNGPHQTTLVRSIVDLAHSLKLQVVAEGIEDDEQRAFLRETSCDLGQGYLFSRPVSPDQISALLTAAAAPQLSLSGAPADA